jgi:hypothetical protein
MAASKYAVNDPNLLKQHMGESDAAKLFYETFDHEFFPLAKGVPADFKTLRALGYAPGLGHPPGEASTSKKERFVQSMQIKSTGSDKRTYDTEILDPIIDAVKNPNAVKLMCNDAAFMSFLTPISKESVNSSCTVHLVCGGFVISTLDQTRVLDKLCAFTKKFIEENIRNVPPHIRRYWGCTLKEWTAVPPAALSEQAVRDSEQALEAITKLDTGVRDWNQQKDDFKTLMAATPRQDLPAGSQTQQQPGIRKSGQDAPQHGLEGGSGSQTPGSTGPDPTTERATANDPHPVRKRLAQTSDLSQLPKSNARAGEGGPAQPLGDSSLRASRDKEHEENVSREKTTLVGGIARGLRQFGEVVKSALERRSTSPPEPDLASKPLARGNLGSEALERRSTSPSEPDLAGERLPQNEHDSQLESHTLQLSRQQKPSTVTLMKLKRDNGETFYNTNPIQVSLEEKKELLYFASRLAGRCKNLKDAAAKTANPLRVKYQDPIIFEEHTNWVQIDNDLYMST